MKSSLEIAIAILRLNAILQRKKVLTTKLTKSKFKLAVELSYIEKIRSL
jgi:hypothetical protein